MAKRDKNRSIEEWENDWNDREYEDSKKRKQKERKKSREQKYNVTKDWDEAE